MLVSVYMPTKNRLQLLQRAVDSVLSQTHREIELWVVDDGSTDGTPEYLERMSARDPRLHCIRNEQSLGAPRARNLAITRARGEFVTGLDDDDYFDPQRIEKLLRAWHEREGQARRFSCLYSQDVLCAGDQRDVSRKPDQVTYQDLFFYNSIGNQIFTKRAFVIAVGLFDEHMPAWQDLDLFMRVVRRYGPALLVDEPLYGLEVGQRDDRISVSNVRIQAAYKRLAAKVADHPGEWQQGLFLQRFGRLYGYRFTARDFAEFWTFGLHLRTAKRLLGIAARQFGTQVRSRDIAEPKSAAAATRGRPTTTVLMFPKHSNNPYLNTLSERLERSGARVDDFTFMRALKFRYEVLHIHWPDLHLHARSPLRGLAKQLRLAFIFALVRVRSGRVVWTVHNLKPHERHHGLAEAFFPMWFPRLCSHVIAMTASSLTAAKQMYPALADKHSAIIPHGDYRHAYPVAPARADARAHFGLRNCFTFLFLGNIRAYKNVPALIKAFRALPNHDIQLLIVGQPGAKMDLDALTRAIGDDSRIYLRLEFVADAEVPLYMAAADRVVLPFDSILNSGSVLLALSFNRGVIAPRLGSLPEIQQRVGAHWLSLYEGALSPHHLEAAQREPIAEGEVADLAAFDWNHITQQTLQFYGARAATAAGTSSHTRPLSEQPSRS